MASKTESRRINLYINGKEVENNIKSIRNEYFKSINALNRMERGSKEYYDQVKKVKQLKGMLNEHNKTLGRVQSSWQKFKTNFGSWISAGFGLAVAGQVFRSFIQNIKEFEKKASELSAITGLMGDELGWLKDKSLGLSRELRLTGIMIKQTSSEILEAFKIVGSAKPELLKNKEALAEVTKQAIVLSEAAGMDLKSAVDSLTLSMNQFNAPASEAGRFVNALAAGSKEGAAEIPDLTNAIKEFGPVARSANISLEQSVALVEALAEKGFKGNRAGIGVRNFLLELQSGADETNPKVVGLDKALENLGNQNLTAAELTKQFGKENVVAAQILIETRTRVEELTEAVSGTNTAYEQAGTNTQNLAGYIDNLSSSWGNFLIRMNEGNSLFSQFLSSMAYGVTTFLDDLAAGSKASEQYINSYKIWRKELREAEKEGELNAQERLGLLAELSEKRGLDMEFYIKKQKELIELYKTQNNILSESINGSDNSSGTDGEVDDPNKTFGDMEDPNEAKISEMESLAAQEIEIHANKLREMEEREISFGSAVKKIHEGLSKDKIEQLTIYANAALQLIGAIQNMQTAAMNRELAAAGDNEQKKEQIRLEYAKKQRNMAILQATINTALGVTMALASLPPPASYAAAIISAAAGAVEIALIASQKFAKGGYTEGEKMYIAGEAGKEYIAPNWQVEHPVYGPIIEDLNQARLGTPPGSNISNITNNYGGDSSRLEEKLDTMISLFADPKNRRAYILRDDLTRSDDEIAELRSLADVA